MTASMPASSLNLQGAGPEKCLTCANLARRLLHHPEGGTEAFRDRTHVTNFFRRSVQLRLPIESQSLPRCCSTVPLTESRSRRRGKYPVRSKFGSSGGWIESASLNRQ